MEALIILAQLSCGPYGTPCLPQPPQIQHPSPGLPLQPVIIPPLPPFAPIIEDEPVRTCTTYRTPGGTVTRTTCY